MLKHKQIQSNPTSYEPTPSIARGESTNLNSNLVRNSLVDLMKPDFSFHVDSINFKSPNTAMLSKSYSSSNYL